jgi:hypothetical protein
LPGNCDGALHPPQRVEAVGQDVRGRMTRLGSGRMVGCGSVTPTRARSRSIVMTTVIASVDVTTRVAVNSSPGNSAAGGGVVWSAPLAPSAGGAWRASLQDAESGERLDFADLEQLFAYLRRLTDDAPDEYGTSTTTER